MQRTLCLLTFLSVVLWMGAPKIQADDRSPCASITKAFVATSNPADETLDTHLTTCKVWPAHPTLALAALALFPNKGSPDMPGDVDLRLLHEGETVHKVRVPLVLERDAITTDHLDLDTAPYQLDPATPAFGLRMHQSGDSRANPYDQTDLSLFAVRHNELVRVIDALPMVVNVGEWDENCAGSFVGMVRTIGMAPTTHHGLNDLTVTTRTMKRTRSKGLLGACVEHSTPATHRQDTLTFDGTRYPVPASLKTLPLGEMLPTP
jgi:hypothetical protein